MAKARKTFHRRWRGQRVTQLLSRDGTRCSICSVELNRHIKDFHHPDYITFDHIIPLSKGGLTIITNLRLAHRKCNETRGNDPIMPEDEKEPQ